MSVFLRILAHLVATVLALCITFSAFMMFGLVSIFVFGDSPSGEAEFWHKILYAGFLITVLCASLGYLHYTAYKMFSQAMPPKLPNTKP